MRYKFNLNSDFTVIPSFHLLVDDIDQERIIYLLSRVQVSKFSCITVYNNQRYLTKFDFITCKDSFQYL